MAARDVFDLRPARDTRRRDDRLGGSGADGGREAVLGYFDGEVVVLFLVAESPRHAATTGVDRLDGVARRQAQAALRRAGAPLRRLAGATVVGRPSASLPPSLWASPSPFIIFYVTNRHEYGAQS